MWSDPDWSYLLGVLHGDGTVGPRAISVSVGYRDEDYKDVLEGAWRRLGYSPKTYRQRTAFVLAVHNTRLRNTMAPFKIKGIWHHPPDLSVWHYLAGIIDTDGHVTPPERRRIVITLKRSGNLSTVAAMLESVGIADVSLRNTATTFRGRHYETETLAVCGIDRMERMAAELPLRHPRKRARLDAIGAHITSARAYCPAWRMVADWLRGEPRTWREIAARFGLTRDQVDSVLTMIRRHGILETLPPPEPLHRFAVRP